jgi:hypothetical protein
MVEKGVKRMKKHTIVSFLAIAILMVPSVAFAGGIGGEGGAGTNLHQVGTYQTGTTGDFYGNGSGLGSHSGSSSSNHGGNSGGKGLPGGGSNYCDDKYQWIAKCK